MKHLAAILLLLTTAGCARIGCQIFDRWPADAERMRVAGIQSGEPRTLPRWQDAWSDGCSVGVAELNVQPAVRAACVRHDEAYYYGGSYADKLRADLALYERLQAVGVQEEIARWAYHWPYALVGGPEFMCEGQSWAWGGAYFAYSAEPAQPTDG